MVDLQLRDRSSVILAGILVVGLVPRLVYWRGFGTLTWDGGNHANGGLLIARTLLNLENPIQYMTTMAELYPNTVGSLFFYPYGYDVLTTISYLVFGFNDFAARFPNMLSSALIPIPVYLLATQIYSREVGYFSAFFASITPYFIQWGGRVLVDVPMTACLTFALYAGIRAIETDNWLDWVGVGVSLAIATLMKPIGLFFFPIIYGWAVIQKPELITKLRFWGSGTIAVGGLASYLASGVLAAQLFPKRGSHLDDAVFHWFTSAATKTEPNDPVVTELSSWTYYADLLPEQMSLLIVALAISGIMLLLVSDREVDSNEKMLLMTIGYVYLFFTILNNKDWRYTLPMIPLLLVFAGFAVNRIRNVDHLPKYLLTGMIILTTIIAGAGAIIEIQDGVLEPTPDTGTDEVGKIVTERSTGKVAIANETNWVSGEAITFYTAIHDPNLNHSVIYDLESQPRWIVSSDPLGRGGEYRRLGDNNETYLYTLPMNNNTA